MNEDEMVTEVRNHGMAARYRDVVRIATVAALLLSVLLIAASLPRVCDRQLDHLTAPTPAQSSVAFDGGASCYVAERGPLSIASAVAPAPRMPGALPAMRSPSSGSPASDEEKQIDSPGPRQWDVASRPLTIELRI